MSVFSGLARLSLSIQFANMLQGGIVVEIINAEQAAKDAKGLTFEKVWAALMETKALQDKT